MKHTVMNDKRKCHNCGRLGHIARNCSKKSDGKRNFVPKLKDQAFKDDIQKLQGEIDALKEIRREGEEAKEAQEGPARRFLEDMNEERFVDQVITFTVPREKLEHEVEQVIITESRITRLKWLGALVMLFSIIMLIIIRASWNFPTRNAPMINNTCFDREVIICKSQMHSCIQAERAKTIEPECSLDPETCLHVHLQSLREQCEVKQGFKLRVCLVDARENCTYIDVVYDFDEISFNVKYIVASLSMLIVIGLMIWMSLLCYETPPFQYYVRRKKMRIHLSDFDTSPEALDLRTDDEQRMDSKHESPIMARLSLTYYESLKRFRHVTYPIFYLYYTALPVLLDAQYKEVKTKTTTIYFEMFVQLIKHANSKRGLTTEVTQEKLDQHASYICSINKDRYDVRHIVSDTVMAAALWQKHNRTEPQRDEVFQTTLTTRIV